MRCLASFILILPIVAFGQNMIINPSAELDPTTNGWNAVSGNWISSIEVTAQEGTYHFYAGSISGTVELYQDVDVSSLATSIDLGTQDFSFSGYMRDFQNIDEGQIIVEYRNDESTILSTYDTGLQSITSWTIYCNTRTAPVNTRTIRIRLLSKRNGGTDNDGYFDNLKLESSSASGLDNFIINNSCECPPSSNGWVIASGNWIRGAEVQAQSGNYHFFAGTSAGTVELYQDINVSSFAADIDAEIKKFKFSGYIRDYNGSDEGQIIVEYRDASSTVLSTYDTGLKSQTTWTIYSNTKTAPANTKTIRIRLLSKRNDGTNSDGYFDNIILKAEPNTLPIKLVNFTATHNINKVVLLEWKTLSEKNNDCFIVERSKDMLNWERLSILDGAGNSSNIITYNSMDKTPYMGMSYYRLKQIDFDGEFSYSKVKSIKLDSIQESIIKVYPNPTYNQVTIEGLENEISTKYIRLFNSRGQDISYTIEINKSSETILKLDLTELQRGIYFIHTKTSTHKIHKQ